MARAARRRWPPCNAAWVRLALAAALGLTLAQPAAAGVLGAASRQSFTDYCSGRSSLTARQQDRVLRLAQAARQELEASGRALAIVSRSGLDLQRFNQRYSHAGLSLREGAELPWAVRQLYFACDEKRPRLFDQGLAGFLMGMDDPGTGYLSIVFLPEGADSAALLSAARDKPRALGLVAPTYSANAYPFSVQYQNCNQWLVELLGLAWGGGEANGRAESQTWLKAAGYQPQAIPIESPLMIWAARFVPLLSLEDHPAEDLAALSLKVSMPASIEQFVRQRMPGAQRVELCHTEGRIVIRHGWEPLPPDCQAEGGDHVLPLD